MPPFDRQALVGENVRMTTNAASFYTERRESFRLREERLSRLDERIAFARLFVFAVLVLLLYLVLRQLCHPAWLLVPVAAFGSLVVWHAAVFSRRSRARAGATFYRDLLARMNGESPFASGLDYMSQEHPYAIDLDLSGQGSLFQRLVFAATDAGRRTLAGWLLASADAEAIRARQEAVAALREDVGTRERMALCEEADDLKIERLLAFMDHAMPPLPRGSALGALLFACITTGAILWWIAGGVALSTVLLCGVVQILHSARYLRKVQDHLEAFESATAGLPRLIQVIDILCESEAASPLLALHRKQLGDARQALSRLDLIGRILENGRNKILALFYSIWQVRLHLYLAARRWMDSHAKDLPGWVESVGRLEALQSLAGFAFERDDSVFPEVIATGPLFSACQMAHPLLPRGQAVANDIRLDAKEWIVIVSGSNMAGKSTLLRCLGTNLVLALAGGPVIASSMTLSPLKIGASIALHDSLIEGRSRFMAEALRIRSILDQAATDPPLLFLLDELLQGTNSHDRLIGGEAILAELRRRGAIGLVTTHDLAITELATRLPGARNLHFLDEQGEEGLKFDYLLREGPVPRGNGLAILAAMGIRPVAWQAGPSPQSKTPDLRQE